MQKKFTKRFAGAALAAVLAATQSLAALPVYTATAAEENGYVYGTVDLPYADYYYGELYEVAENDTMDLTAEDPASDLRAEGYYDAVTSATSTKSVKYETTYYTENEDGSVTVEGIQGVSIAVESSLYEAATAAISSGETCNNQLLEIIGNMTVNEDQTTVPTEYKILNGDGSLTAMIDANEMVTVTDATITVETNTTYGNYEIEITEAEGADSYFPDSSNMEGVVITMTDGTKYAMLHVDNLWLRSYLIAWAIEDNYVVHNQNTLKYLNFVDTEGKTIESVKYIIRDGADVTYSAEAYLPYLHDGTVTAENVAVDSGSIALTYADLPDGYVPVAEISDLGTTYADGVLTYDTDGVVPGSYTVTVSDENDYYASISTSVVLTTDALPATFDTESNTIVAATDADETDFANYLSNLSTATVNGTSYSLSGHGSVKVIDTSTGALNLEVTSNDALVFGESGTYEITVSATGYTTDLTFSVDVVVTNAKGDMDQDGLVSLNDAYEILMYYAQHQVGIDYVFTEDAETEATLEEMADVDSDGEITLNDAYYTLLYYATSQVGDASWDSILSE